MRWTRTRTSSPLLAHRSQRIPARTFTLRCGRADARRTRFAHNTSAKVPTFTFFSFPSFWRKNATPVVHGFAPATSKAFPPFEEVMLPLLEGFQVYGWRVTTFCLLRESFHTIDQYCEGILKIRSYKHFDFECFNSTDAGYRKTTVVEAGLRSKEMVFKTASSFSTLMTILNPYNEPLEPRSWDLGAQKGP